MRNYPHLTMVLAQGRQNYFDKIPVFIYLSLTFGAGIAQLVEHYLAKVAVASSSLVARSIFISSLKAPVWLTSGGVWKIIPFGRRHSQEAKATVCKIVIPGSNPGAASNENLLTGF